MKAFIYKIENICNNSSYIGSTTNYSRRIKRHFEDLTKGNHHSVILQRAFNKYHRDSFIVVLLETFNYNNKKHILDKEQEYLDKINPEYNICKVAGSQLGSKRSDEFKEKCSKRMKGKNPWNKGLKTGIQSEETIMKRSKSMVGKKHSKETTKKIINKLSKVVIQYDCEGNFITEWASAKEASRIFGCSYTSLIAYLNGNSNINTFKNYIWKRK